MNSICEICGSETDCDTYIICALKPIAGEHIFFEHVGTHPKCVCRKCSRHAFIATWMVTAGFAIFACLMLSLVVVAAKYGERANGSNPLVVVAVILSSLVFLLLGKVLVDQTDEL